MAPKQINPLAYASYYNLLGNDHFPVARSKWNKYEYNYDKNILQFICI